MNEITLQQLDAIVKETLTGARYRHTLGVVETAAALAQQYGCDPEKARKAAYLHDLTKDCAYNEHLEYCKRFSILPSAIEQTSSTLLHAITGAYYAKNILHLRDTEIFDAIRYHTTGRQNMSVLEKVLYLAAYIEPGRKFDGVKEVRKLVRIGMDAALRKALANTIIEVAAKPAPVHIDTIECYNQLMMEKETDQA